jgi:hypothetical protein
MTSGRPLSGRPAPAFPYRFLTDPDEWILDSVSRGGTGLPPDRDLPRQFGQQKESGDKIVTDLIRLVGPTF